MPGHKGLNFIVLIANIYRALRPRKG